MSSKPTLGYGSRAEAVIALRAQGLTAATISQRIGIAEGTVKAITHKALHATQRINRPAEEFSRTVVFPVDLLEQLQPHADRRNMHVNKLARLIVETVIDDNMIDAVLDDREAIDG